MQVGHNGFERFVPTEVFQVKKSVHYANQSVDMLEELHMWDVERHKDQILQRMVYTLKADVYGNVIESIRHPKDWKQAFKERWFPQWLLKRYPVEYKEYTLDVIIPGLKALDNAPYMRLYIKGESPFEKPTYY